jgi:hypothetical protein
MNEQSRQFQEMEDSTKPFHFSSRLDLVENTKEFKEARWAQVKSRSCRNGQLAREAGA